MKLTEEKLFERCGVKLTRDKVKQMKKQFEDNGKKTIVKPGTPQINCFVNGYKVLAYLGTGSFGTVCLASKENFYFAMKFMHINECQSGPDKEFKKLRGFLKDQEHAKFLTALEWREWTNSKDKAAMATLKDKGQKLCYMVMKLCGPSLQMMLDEKRRSALSGFSIKEGVPIMKNALEALRLLQEKKLIHHDIKLDNFAIDLSDSNRVLILDYGMIAGVPFLDVDDVGFKGTPSYASRRALQQKTLSYRDDYESWVYCLYRFLFGTLLRIPIRNPLNEKKKFWSSGSVTNLNIIKIMRHIDLLDFREKMNYKFVQDCLQDLMDEAAGIIQVPYLYKKGIKESLQIVHGIYKFNSTKADKKKSRIRFRCSHSSCNFTIFVEMDEFKNAQENGVAVVVDTRNNHECLTV